MNCSRGKNSLKYIAVIIVALVALYALIRLSSCDQEKPEIVTVVTPADTNFMPIVKKQYRPPSTPFERRSKRPVRLPRGVKEKDVARVVIITKQSTADRLLRADTTRMIELKTGEIFVERGDSIEMRVDEIVYSDPILLFDLFASAGISAGKTQSGFSVSPVAAVSPLQILGVVQAPILLADLNGAGIGVGYRWGNILFGAGSYWSYEGLERNLKFSIHYAIN